MEICGITGSTGVLGKKIIKNLPFKFYKFKDDITNYYKVEKWINKKKIDLIIHLAALVPTYKVIKNYKKAYRINVLGTKNLIKAIEKKKNKPKWFFFASSSHVYKIQKKNILLKESLRPKPYTKYGKTKFYAEKILIKNFAKKNFLCIGRIFSFTDKYQKNSYVVPNIYNKIKVSKSKKIELKNLNHYRDFLSTKEIAFIIFKLYKKNKTGIFNIGSGKKINLKIIAKLIAKKYKKEIKFRDNKPTYLISNNSKLKKLNIKFKKFKNNLNYFY
tara:strand:- start:616 stop:1434 length:819 start_codon:yes stop_codon:yes gene_type:complete